jgi:predicted  nucleic acid-binding Zn-ribbon protein
MEMSIDDLPTEPLTPPTKTSEALRANLQSVNSQLESMKKEWEDERRKLVGENAVLQNAANRLNVQVRAAREEVRKVAESGQAKEKAKAGIQGVRVEICSFDNTDKFLGPRQSQESHW